MTALSSGGIANGKSWCGWDLEQIKHFKHWRGWLVLPDPSLRACPGGCTARRPLAFETDEPGEREASLRSHRRKRVRRVVKSRFFWNKIFYLETRIERQRVIIDGLEAEGYGGEVIRRSRVEVEGALAVQMACTHTAALSVLARFSGGGGSERRVVALASAAARLMRAYSGQVETLRRLRHGGDQHDRVEHIHINEGAQAVIGTVRALDRRHDAATGVPSQDQRIDSDPQSIQSG